MLSIQHSSQPIGMSEHPYDVVMSINELRVAGYRSIRNLRMPLKRLNVLTGPNGCGKSNLYNAVFLLAKTASGGFPDASRMRVECRPCCGQAGGRRAPAILPVPTRCV